MPVVNFWLKKTWYCMGGLAWSVTWVDKRLPIFSRPCIVCRILFHHQTYLRLAHNNRSGCIVYESVRISWIGSQAPELSKISDSGQNSKSTSLWRYYLQLTALAALGHTNKKRWQLDWACDFFNPGTECLDFIVGKSSLTLPASLYGVGNHRVKCICASAKNPGQVWGDQKRP